MKKLITALFILITTLSFSADNGNPLISEIIVNIDNYKNNTIVLNLRLKYLDRIFEKIVFYDSENVDVEFDISGKTKRTELSGNLINIHEGMMYRVKFTVVGAGIFGGLTGDLHEFTPVILDKIPAEEN
ncbi:MAG TPA: hypothetical protein PKG60_02190 [Spirochaetota bacterium]|jgi:hypothetical protein|nr:hypothetical protein [Spirochaetota bacterium]HPS85903.1 hypothetical protein [Spirochaetota bacterium]